jgi:hypothetical protein
MLVIAGTGRESYVLDLQAKAASLERTRRSFWVGHWRVVQARGSRRGAGLRVLPSLSGGTSGKSFRRMPGGSPGARIRSRRWERGSTAFTPTSSVAQILPSAARSEENPIRFRNHGRAKIVQCLKRSPRSC